MVQEQIADLIAAELPFALTEEQREAALRLGAFIADPRSDRCFALRGYAGTGKTTLIGALVKVLRKVEIPVVLLAPTGRAAKVFSQHAGGAAYTIHRVIYRQETFIGQDTAFQLGFNRLKRAVFIVDEASMIGSGNGFDTGGTAQMFGTGQLLDDLVHFVFEGQGNKLLLVGDTAQLPPVGEDESPALLRDVLLGYGLLVSGMQLTQVIRQEQESSVLTNATMLRHLISNGEVQQPIITFGKEVCRMPGDELVEALCDAYDEFGSDGTIVVTRSNRQANVYNNGIRARIFDREEQLCRGDLVMAVKNNYHWTRPKAVPQKCDNPTAAELTAAEAAQQVAQKMPFIANGDVAKIERLSNVHEEFGFHFADATLSFPDYDDVELECRVLLDTLQSESPALSADDQRRLYAAVEQDYAHIASKKERAKAVREDPYYNALQIKYAYAVTCHKAQGGQWPRVFVDQGYLPPEGQDIGYLRWLYTAFTRTTDRVYLVNWPQDASEYRD